MRYFIYDFGFTIYDFALTINHYYQLAFGCYSTIINHLPKVDAVAQGNCELGIERGGAYAIGIDCPSQDIHNFQLAIENGQLRMKREGAVVGIGVEGDGGGNGRGLGYPFKIYNWRAICIWDKSPHIIITIWPASTKKPKISKIIFPSN